MCKVYVINDNNRDFSKATTYGELVFVTKGMQPVFKLEKLSDSLVSVLKDFTEDDCLLLSGPNIVNMLSAIYLLEKFDGINILIHDAKNDTYVLKCLDKALCVKED